MRLAIKLLSTAIWGFSVHQTAPLIDTLAPGWKNLTAYGVGILSAFPFGIWLNREFADTEDADKRWALVFISLFFSYGAGVAVGYIMSTLSDNLHPINRSAR